MPSAAVRKENIENVLDNSLYLFAEYGVCNTTIKMIAEKANLTTRSIQNYFENKDELIIAVLKHELNKAESLYRTELAQPYYAALNGLEQIRAMIKIAMKYGIEKSRFTYGILCIAYGSGTSLAERWAEQHLSFEEYTMKQIRKALKKGIEEKLIPEKCNSDEMVKILMLSLHSMVQEIAGKCISHGETKEIKKKLYRLAEVYAEKEVSSLAIK